MANFRITRNVYTMPSSPPPTATAGVAAPRPEPEAGEPPVYSVVVSLHNGGAAAGPLHERIGRAMRRMGKPYEIVLVNDGSTDETGKVLEQIAWRDPRVTVLDLWRHFGPAAAMQAGFDASRGSVVIAMDTQIRHDPREIPLLARKIDEGYDMAVGYRHRRRRGLGLSGAANWLLAKASGVTLRDFAPTLKAYRREVLEGVRLYGHMHRFVPVICSKLGATLCQVRLKDIPRPRGQRRGGLGRAVRLALELLALRFTMGCLVRPLLTLGTGGLLAGAAGAGILAYGLVRKLLHWNSPLPPGHVPLMAAGFLLAVAAVVLFATGLIGELLTRIYFEAAGNKTYAVRRVIRRDPPPDREPDRA